MHSESIIQEIAWGEWKLIGNSLAKLFGGKVDKCADWPKLSCIKHWINHSMNFKFYVMIEWKKIF